MAREKNRKNKKTKKHNRGLKFLTTLLTLLIIAVSLLLIGYNYILENFLSEINFFDLDRDDIGINKDALKVEGVKTILILGKDEGSFDDKGRSDVIILASINTKLKTLKLISIPRDTVVPVPDYWTQKINEAYFYGGPELTLKTINSNFDLHVDDYLVIDYAGVADLVDAVGGIELELTKQEIYHVNERIEQTIKHGKINSKVKSLNAEPGLVRLNGVQAVSHARDRSSVDTDLLNDYGRTNRQRNIIEATAKELAKQSLPQIMDITQKFLNSVRTSISKETMLKYILEIVMYKTTYIENIKSYQNPSHETGSYLPRNSSLGRPTENYPDFEVAKELFNQYINEE